MMKKYLVIFLKIAFSVAIIAYLIWSTTSGEGKENALENLKNGEKNWGYLALAWVFATAAVMTTFVRWWYLVRAVEIPCKFRDAWRIGFWGYLFNFLPLGIVSGDLIKIVMLAHEHPQYKTKAAASVFVDRVIGLYILFVVASVAILATGYLNFDLPAPIIHTICVATLVLTVVGGVGIAVCLSPHLTESRFTRWLENLPRVGHILEKLIDSVRMYRSRPMVLFTSSLMTVFVHSFGAISVYLIACGLPGATPLLSLHFVVVPLSMVTQVIPCSIGPLEFALEKLYMNLPASAGAIVAGQGFVVALCYRLITVLIAALGIRYYLGNRKEFSEAMHESEQEAG
jgi:uncharacterized protein (TIRG00374 family)